MIRLLFYSVLVTLTFSCSKVEYTLVNYDFPNPVDTRSKPITEQEYGVFKEGNVYVSNNFPSARMNGFSQVNDTLYSVRVAPENQPINHSAWYAFKIWSDTIQEITVKLDYDLHFHRYSPKISRNGDVWGAVNRKNITLAADSVDAYVKLMVSPDTLWVSAQEIQDHKKVGEWVKRLADSYDFVTRSSAGNSAKGRALYFMDITQGEKANKPVLVFFSRQHPPEVTGYFALQSFLEEILERGQDNGFLDKFRVMVYPILNPDGVDLGHWRHNTGGVDLNRDWSMYHQTETRTIAEHIITQVNESNNPVILGLDFHSTFNDVYYTFDESVNSELSWFTTPWLSAIERSINQPDFSINEAPSGLGSPVSKGWFFVQFNAESITYEIGDNTPKDFIETKGKVSAREMMRILLENYTKIKNQ